MSGGKDRFIQRRREGHGYSGFPLASREQDTADSTPYLRLIGKDLLTQPARAQFGNPQPLFSQRPLLPSAAFRVISAPQLVDDTHLCPLGWGPAKQVLLLLKDTAYLYEPERTFVIDRLQTAIYTAVTPGPVGSVAALANSLGRTTIYDLAASRRLRQLGGHSSRVSALSWESEFFTGGMDKLVQGHDLRIGKSQVYELVGHQGQITGIQQQGRTVVSGSADGKAIIWDLRANRSSCVVTMKGPVKGVSMTNCHPGLLALADCSMESQVRIIDLQGGAPTVLINPGAQVCSLLLLKNRKQIACGLGFGSNSIQIWSLDCGVKEGQLQGHCDRVLGLAEDMEGRTLCSVSSDQTMRFWQLQRQRQIHRPSGTGLLERMILR